MIPDRLGEARPRPVMVAPGVSAARLADIEGAAWLERDQATAERAEVQIEDVQADNAAAPVPMDASDAEIRALAERRAALMMDRVAEAGATAMQLPVLLRWLNAEVQAMQGGRLRVNTRAVEVEQKVGLIARATDRAWWTKALRKAQTVAQEAAGRKSGQVCARRQPYITNTTMRRRMDRDEANADILSRTVLQNEDGQEFTVLELAERSVSNPAIRRGELMTRIRGCEEWAEAHGMAGIFTTHTTPSRFHAVHHHGAINDKWIRAGRPTPKDGQQWLCKAWQRARAALDRRGLRFFGFRVAEPHHDGTPHWHGLFFCAAEDREAIASVIRAVWLKDEGNEPGAQERRFLWMPLERGGAAGYIAKYIAKGIDDEGAVGVEGHDDDDLDGRTVRMDQADLFGGGARRVKAWASAHGIRQFQPLGQPPVTVWRELRRVTEGAAQQGSERIQAMWQAAQREGDKRASWAVYLLRQGGPMVGRDYRVGMATEDRVCEGVYETATLPKPVGVVDRIEARQVYSSRKEWKPRGAWTGKLASTVVRGTGAGRVTGAVGHSGAAGGRAVPPWTRVNNCTGQGGARPLVMDWREAFPPDLVREIESKAMREGQSHTKAGGAPPPPRVSHPPQGSCVHGSAGGVLHHGQGFPQN